MSFRTIAMDPPWGADAGGGGRGAQNHYPLIHSVDEMSRVIRMAPVWRPDPACCSVWMWCTAGSLGRGDAHALMQMLGARPVTIRTWVKMDERMSHDEAEEMMQVYEYGDNGQHYVEMEDVIDALCGPKRYIGLGQRFRWMNEFLMLGTIGRVPVPKPNNRVLSCLFAPPGVHSAKPDRAYLDMIKHDGPGLRAELFARRPRDGWEVWGNEIAPPAATPEPPPQKGDGRCVHDALCELLSTLQVHTTVDQTRQLSEAIDLACDVGGVELNGLIRDILARKEFGLRKYGTTLQPHNGRNALNDAYQEALDLCCYLMQHHMEQGPRGRR